MASPSIDELYARWQRNPDAAMTTALCEALRGSPRADLVEIVGSHASRQLELGPLLAAARMYTESGRLEDAQTVLVAAGRLAPRDGDVYRWLGEVLLRRGDAERAEKVLERAVQFGASDSGAAQALLAKARSLLPTQRSSGAMAVANEVAKALASERNRVSPRIVPRLAGIEDDDVETQIRKSDDIKGVMEAALAPLSQPPRPAAGNAFQQVSTAPNPHAFGMPPSMNAPAPFGAPPRSTPPPPLAAPVVTAPPAMSQAPMMPPPSARANPFANTAKAPPKDGGLAPLSAKDFAQPGESAYRGANAGAVPEPRDVLEALQIAGVYEPTTDNRPEAVKWAKPERGKRRILGTISLIAMAVLFVGGGIGIFQYVKTKREKDHVIAEQNLASIDALVRTSDTKNLERIESELSHAFELESRSPHAATTWLHERALKGLLTGGEELAFEESIARAKDVGVPDRQIAFANVASFLFQNDTAGAAAQLAKWDSIAQDEAWYELMAGATFERAGDSRALERYATAVKLDPDLLVAKFLLARAMAVDGDPRQAAQQAKDLRGLYPERVEPIALVALAWARDPFHGDEPPEVKDVSAKADALPISLRSVAHASRAIVALESHKLDEAKPALQKALAQAETPGIAAWIGSLALSMGDEALARKGALTAVSYSAVYPPARVLAARVALLATRLDEALKAVEDLPPTSPDVAVVTAAVAYEKVDGERMARAFEAMDPEAKKLPFVMPLAKGKELLAGNPKEFGGADKILDMADDDGPWADLVSMDAALELGDLELASKISSQWTGDLRAPRAVRLARLARYREKLDDADRLSKGALEGGTVTLRTLAERVFVLVAMNKAPEALALFKVNPNVGGPMAKWLRAYALASNKKEEEAKAAVSSEDPPPPLAPLPARTIAAMAYGAMKDTRHGNEYVKPLLQAGFLNPDLVTAAEKVGLPKMARPARR